MTSSKLHYQRKLTAGHLCNDVGGEWLVEGGENLATMINERIHYYREACQASWCILSVLSSHRCIWSDTDFSVFINF